MTSSILGRTASSNARVIGARCVLLLFAAGGSGCAGAGAPVEAAAPRATAEPVSSSRGFEIVDLPHSIGAIVPERYAQSAWLDMHVERIVVDRFWTPGPQDVLRAYSRIRAMLTTDATSPEGFIRARQLDDESLGHFEFGKIVEHFDEFTSQYLGVVVDGHRQMLCSFFPAKMGGLDEWIIVPATDLGFWYWRVLYDLESDRCIDFAQGGDA